MLPCIKINTSFLWQRFELGLDVFCNLCQLGLEVFALPAPIAVVCISYLAEVTFRHRKHTAQTAARASSLQHTHCQGRQPPAMYNTITVGLNGYGVCKKADTREL